MSSQGNLHSADYQTDIPIYESVSLPSCVTTSFLTPKCVNNKNLIIIPATGNSEVSHKQVKIKLYYTYFSN